MSSHRGRPKAYQVTWYELEPWLQQLKEDHGVDCLFEVVIPMHRGSMKPAIVLTAVRKDWPRAQQEIKRDWKTFGLDNVGEVERLALQMVSMLLLELERSKSRGEQAALPF